LDRRFLSVKSDLTPRAGSGKPVVTLIAHPSCSAICSGVTIGSNRARTLPSLPTRNLVKFQPISGLPSGLAFSDLSMLYKSQAPSPFTSTLENSWKLQLYLLFANSRISSSLPGSCAPNWLQGKPRTFRSSRSFSNAHRPVYCPVRPHWLARFITSIA